MAFGKSVASAIRSIRLEKDITVTAMAESIGVTRGHMSQIEMGKRPLPLDTLKLICTELGVSPATVVRRAEKDE